ncbi:MAG: DNA repair protein RecN, partial [Armatimonadota bacterium]
PALLGACAQRTERIARLRAERDRIVGDARERTREAEFLAHQIAEIDLANLQPGEIERLTTEREILAQADRLAAAAETARGHLFGTTLDSLAKAVSALERVDAIDPGVAPLLEGARNALFAAEDAARGCRAYRDAIEFDPERLQGIDDRLELIRSLQRKYGEGVAEILAYRAEAAQRLDHCQSADQRSESLESEIASEEAALLRDCAELSRLRNAAAGPLGTAIQGELADLAMAGTRFEVELKQTDPGSQGSDRVAFRIAPNPGEPSRSLARTASGGESSRLMLALKTVLSRTQSLPTLVFDEVDAGIGGRTAVVLGNKLRSLADEVQVLCITHLAQIAACGDTHFRVEKRQEDGRTLLSIEQLEGEDRVAEVARMLSGDTGETARTHARELLAGR